MQSYKCVRCGYSTNRKYNMNLHLKFDKKKKGICKPLLSSDCLTSQESLNEIFNICNFCGVNYSNPDKKTEHQLECENFKKHIELSNEVKEVKNSFMEIKEEMQQLKRHSSRKNNYFNVNISQLNFQLRDYDNPSTSHLTKDLILNNLDEPESIKKAIFENIYYNDDVPENHSFLIIRTSSKQFLIFGHKKNRMIELSEQEINDFISNNFCNRYGGIVKRLIGHSYRDLSDEDKEQIDEQTYYSICSTKNSQDIKSDILLTIQDTDNNELAEQTINIFHKQDKIFVPSKVQKYLKYTSYD